ncbi:MAG: XrtA/PEP-CTERM system amidotransferase [Sphingopyxis sp.]
MCGIAGLYHPEQPRPLDPARVAAMLAPMQHRGPDGQGVWHAPGVVLGHLRLSIIDVAGSPQPMHSADGRLSIVFNGEIYNFQELRRELAGRGHHFRTDGDTEVILAAYAQWGVGALSRLDGMFAFALFDAQDQSLLLARDRFGVKPLFHTQLPDGSLAFASELKGLLALPTMRVQAQLTAVEDYLAYGYVPDDNCMVAGVEKLPAGHYLHIRRGLPMPQPVQWWDLDFTRRITVKEAEAEEHLVHLLRAAVRSRMVADVPLGAFLSGGVDSSAVVALMAEASSSAVNSCSIGFDDAALDETSYADVIARRFATDHRTRIVAADDFALADTVAFHCDEPFADASALPTFRVSQMAREEVTVALSGDGADEAFAGYRRMVFQHQEERVRRFLPAGVRAGVIGPMARAWPKMDWAPRPLRAKATLTGLARSGAQAYALGVGIMGPEMRATLLNDATIHALNGHVAEERWWRTMANAPAAEPLDRAQYADMKIAMPGQILTKVDRMSMAVSLEAREPLLDHHLVEFAATLPASMRVRGATGKYLMKKAMERYLPRDILYRPKMGFVTPISRWFRGPLAAQARALAASPTLARTGWFDMKAIDAMVTAHQSGLSDHGRPIWQFFMLEKSLQRLFGI